MKIGRLVSATAVSTLLLTGCSAPDSEIESSSEPTPTVSVEPASTPTPTPTPTPTTETNARGEVVKGIGEVAGVRPAPGEPSTLQFKVTSIKQIKCDNPNPLAADPNGIALAVNLEIKTSADFEGPLVRNGQDSGITFSSLYWRGYTKDGTRMNTVESDMTGNCLADEPRVLPDWIGPG